MSREKRNEAVVRGFTDVVMNAGHVERIREFLADTFVDHTPMAGQATGIDGVVQFVTTLRRAFPDFHETIECAVAQGDLVAVRVTGRGTHLGEYLGVGPTGRVITFAGMGMLRVVDGRETEHWGYPDVTGVLGQLGWTLPSLATVDAEAAVAHRADRAQSGAGGEAV